MTGGAGTGGAAWGRGAMAEDEARRDEVAEAGRVLAGLGLVTAFGHVSARAGAAMLITPAAELGGGEGAGRPGGAGAAGRRRAAGRGTGRGLGPPGPVPAAGRRGRRRAGP